MYAFDIERPTTIADAVAALKSDEAQPLSGGQTLIPTLKSRLAAPSKLVSLSSISEMVGMSDEGGVLRIGGATKHDTVAKEAGGSHPGLAGLAGKIGDPAVRHRGTIGGSIANNDPAACYPAAALAHGATIVTDRREIAADDFFTGMFDTALEEGEIVTAVKFPRPEASNYQKFEQPASRFAMVGVFVAKFAVVFTRIEIGIKAGDELASSRATDSRQLIDGILPARRVDGVGGHLLEQFDDLLFGRATSTES